MKLYTEDDMLKAFREGNAFLNNDSIDFKGTFDNLINGLTPIELPTDEEITDQGLFDYASKHGEHCDPAGYSDKQVDRWHGFYDGATWVINKIKGGK
jgi:hypothetical protein